MYTHHPLSSHSALLVPSANETTGLGWADFGWVGQILDGLILNGQILEGPVWMC